MPKIPDKGIVKHLNNIVLLILSGGFFWLGASFLEYEISKIRNIGFLPIQTPKYLTFTISGIQILASIIILVILILIYYKKLENRNWLWVLVFLQSIGLIILSAVLGYNKFIWILFPQTFSIFN